MQSPVALELLELLARSHIPQPDRTVVRPTDKQGGIRRIETDAIYFIAAIFSNVSFTGTTLRLSPAERGVGVGKTVTLTVLPTEDEKGLAGSPMSGESQLALAVCDAPHFDGAVIQPSDELPSVCRAELEAGDAMAAIFSNVS